MTSRIIVPEGRTAYDYQIEGAEFALSRRNSLIADEMGLGKSIQALLVANSLPRGSTIVITCPASIVINWEREAAIWSPNNSVRVVSDSSLKKVERHKIDLLIIDESHRTKNPKSQRSKLTQTIHSWSQKTIALSGTPILNKPIEVFTLLHMFNHRLAQNFFTFALRYCAAKKLEYGWYFDGFSNCEELKSGLSDVMIRRTKAEVLKDLPPKVRHLRIVSISGTERLIEKERELYELKAQRIVESIAEIAKIRQELAIKKLPYLKEVCLECLDQTDKLVIFFHHRAPLFALQSIIEGEGICCVTLTGDMGLEARQTSVDRFQHGDARVILLTFGAGSEGITLTAAATMIMAECDWTPARLMQAEDRCHRIGQSGSVNIFYVVIENSLDAHIAKTAQAKGGKICRIIEGDLLSGI